MRSKCTKGDENESKDPIEKEIKIVPLDLDPNSHTD